MNESKNVTSQNTLASCPVCQTWVVSYTGDKSSVVIYYKTNVRPLTPSEINRKDTNVVTFQDNGSLSVNQGGSHKTFTFDTLLEPEADQEDVFEQSGIKRLVKMAVEGYSCMVMAFGQTGSGKTHTMTGPPTQTPVGTESLGVVQRSIHYLFFLLAQQKNYKYTMKASHTEIYNEQVIDLLNPQPWRQLMIRWSKNKQFYVENQFQVECDSVNRLMSVLEEGMRNRHVGSHSANDFSSRSHAILTITITVEMPHPDDPKLWLTRKGKLTFADLAGSEKVRATSLTEDILVESNSINKSLLVLGKCISCLGDPKKKLGHIPYRDSKLTKLLSDCLSGTGVILFISCITASSYNVTETMNTLRYSTRAKCIQTKPMVLYDSKEKFIGSLKRDIQILRNENNYLKQQELRTLQYALLGELGLTSDVVNIPPEDFRKLEFPTKPRGQSLTGTSQKIAEYFKQQEIEAEMASTERSLYEMLQEYMVENEALRSENRELQVEKDIQRREQQQLHKENEGLVHRVEQLERIIGLSPFYRKLQSKFPWQPVPPYTATSEQQMMSTFEAPHHKSTVSYRLGNGPGLLDPLYPTLDRSEYPDYFPDRTLLRQSNIATARSVPVWKYQEQTPKNSPRQVPMNSEVTLNTFLQGHILPRGSDPMSGRPSAKLQAPTDSMEMFNRRLREELAAIDGEIKNEQFNQVASKLFK